MYQQIPGHPTSERTVKTTNNLLKYTPCTEQQLGAGFSTSPTSSVEYLTSRRKWLITLNGDIMASSIDTSKALPGHLHNHPMPSVVVLAKRSLYFSAK